MSNDPEPPSLSEKSTLAQNAQPTASFGRYKLLQRLGEGGMGEVWLAEQIEPVRRQVALKVIKAGMDSAQVVARFEAERQALALMHHPAIATVFDGGTSPQGRPYFAMEYVKGEPITAYCDRHRLSTRQRLELFTQACDGVQHAHQKGVIHRDLKPSNVLVTIQDDRPAPKIIDFGVAKATAQHLTERSLFTELGVLIGTPEYMSPEQAEMGGLDIDTRTDIYALGVLLYELLTGALPFDRRQLRQAGIAEIQRIIREKEPPRPSTRVTQLGPASTEAAKNRNTEARRLVSDLRGDLDWITMRALEKDRTRRYQTANALAADVRRHLNHEPVYAGPPSVGYRAGKYVRRHTFGVAAAAVFVLLLIGFAATMAVQSARLARERDAAANERDKAEKVSAFLVDLFNVSDPSEAKGNTVTAREILDKGVEKIAGELKEQPAVKAALMDTMSRVYEALGLYDKARTLAQEALKLRRHLLGNEHADVATSLHTLARVLSAKGEAVEAEALYREALAMRRKLLGHENPDVARSLMGLAGVLSTKGDNTEAEALYREALAMRRKLLGHEHPDVASSLAGLALSLYAQGDYPQAEALDREALAMQRRLHGNQHPDVALGLNNLAGVLYDKGDHAEAEALYREALAVWRKVVGNEHPQVAVAMFNLAMVTGARGDHAEARALYHETLAMRRKLLGDEHPDVAQSLGALASTLHAQGDYAAAEALYREALAMQRKLLGDEHPDVAWSLDVLAELLSDRGDPTGAETLAREALRMNRKLFGNTHPYVADNLSTLGQALRDLRRLSEAEKALQESLEIRRKAFPPDHPDIATSLVRLGSVLTAEGRAQEAEPMLRLGLDIRRKRQAKDHPSVAGAESALGASLTWLRRFDEAESLLLHCYPILRSTRSASRSTREARQHLIDLYGEWGKPEKAAVYQAQNAVRSQ